jgi:hypothetical protein
MPSGTGLKCWDPQSSHTPRHAETTPSQGAHPRSEGVHPRSNWRMHARRFDARWAHEYGPEVRNAIVNSPLHVRHDTNFKTSTVFERLTPQVSLQLPSGLGGYTRQQWRSQEPT